MKNPYYRVWLAICFATLMSVQGYAQNKETASRLATYFSPGTTDVISPDDDGFIRRWLLLEPIDKPNHSSEEHPERTKKLSDGLKAAGINNIYYESPGTAHEFLTWRRCLKEFAPLLFK